MAQANGTGGTQGFDEEYDVVVAGAGSAGCIVASRLSENPNISLCVIEAGKARQQSLDSHSPRLRQDRAQSEIQLGLRDGSRGGTQQSQGRLAARQGARRLRLDQWPRLPAWRAQRFRRMGKSRRDRLGLQGRAALLQEKRAQRARRRSMARRRRPHAPVQHQEPLGAQPRLRRILRHAAIPAQCRLQWREDRGRRHGAAQRPQWPPRQHRRRLSQTQPRSSELDPDDPHLRAQDHPGGQTRHRRRGRTRRRRRSVSARAARSSCRAARSIRRSFCWRRASVRPRS